jgi:hypothetical protein
MAHYGSDPPLAIKPGRSCSRAWRGSLIAPEADASPPFELGMIPGDQQADSLVEVPSGVVNIA